MFGMMSGSSVANAVTVGSLTIPAMIRLGYSAISPAAVEAASSTGGQITPPIMGAAAFLMIEFLNLPYQTIIIAAIVPAFMHFFGVFMQVHFEAKRTGLRGLTRTRCPTCEDAAANWPTLIPLVLLIWILVSGARRISPRSPASRRASWSGCSRAAGHAGQYRAAGVARAAARLITRQFGDWALGVHRDVVAVPLVHRALQPRIADRGRDLVEASRPAPSTRWRSARRRRRSASSSASSR